MPHLGIMAPHLGYHKNTCTKGNKLKINNDSDNDDDELGNLKINGFECLHFVTYSTIQYTCVNNGKRYYVLYFTATSTQCLILACQITGWHVKIKTQSL